jgi:hypothetical protein
MPNCFCFQNLNKVLDRQPENVLVVSNTEEVPSTLQSKTEEVPSALQSKTEEVPSALQT